MFLFLERNVSKINDSFYIFFTFLSLIFIELKHQLLNCTLKRARGAVLPICYNCICECPGSSLQSKSVYKSTGNEQPTCIPLFGVAAAQDEEEEATSRKTVPHLGSKLYSLPTFKSVLLCF